MFGGTKFNRCVPVITARSLVVTTLGLNLFLASNFSSKFSSDFLVPKSGCGTSFVESAFATISTIFSSEKRSRQIGAAICSEHQRVQRATMQSVVTITESV